MICSVSRHPCEKVLATPATFATALLCVSIVKFSLLNDLRAKGKESASEASLDPEAGNRGPEDARLLRILQ